MGRWTEMSGIPKGYKKTEVGVIPEDWDVKKLGELYKITAAGDYDKEIHSSDFSEQHLYPIYSNSISNEGIFGYSKISRYKENCITVTGRGNLGHAFCRVSFFDAIGRLLCLEPLQKVNSVYFAAYINYGIDFPVESTGVPQLTGPQVVSVTIPAPPFSEQNAIAEVLSDMDALIEAQKELIAKKRAIKQGTMQDLLSGRVRLPGYETKGWKHTDIGDVPDDWDVKKLGEEGVFLTTSSYTRSELREYGDVACLHYGDIHTRFDTWLDCSSTELPMISRDMVKQYPYLKNGDLVIADASEDYEGLGDCVEICNIDSRLCIGGLHTIVYRAKPGLFAPSYIGLLRNLQLVRNQLVSQAVGTKVYSLTNSMIGSILVPVPSLLSEQQAIAEVLSDMDDELETLEAELKKLNHMKRGMMQELLMGRIRLI